MFMVLGCVDGKEELNIQNLIDMRFNIELTFSKIMSFLILATAFVYSLTVKESSVFIAAIPVSAGLLANKQYNDRKKQEAANE